MTEREFYSWQTNGGSDDLIKLISLLEQLEISWCMIGGLAVNHWAKEPMVTQDVDIVVAMDQVDKAVSVLQDAGFTVNRFQWSINLTGKSKVSIQISTEEMYRQFPSRAVPADIHGILMRVACLKDTLSGKIAAFSDKERRKSKKQKDLADIARLMEEHPELTELVPKPILDRINSI